MWGSEPQVCVMFWILVEGGCRSHYFGVATLALVAVVEAHHLAFYLKGSIKSSGWLISIGYKASLIARSNHWVAYAFQCYCCCLGIALRAQLPDKSVWLLHPN